jgi:hypothetical protein
MGWQRSAAGAKRPNGSATTYVKNCTPAESRENLLRRPRSSRVGGNPTPRPQAHRRAHSVYRGGGGCSADDREVAMEREEAELRALQQGEASLSAANERIRAMAEELRKAELVRDRLEGLDRLMGSYPEGHDMRTRLEALHVDRALEEVYEDIRVLMDALQHPRGT